MKDQKKYARAIAIVFFAVLPQLLIWLHHKGFNTAVTFLCVIFALIHVFVILRFLLVIASYTPTGLALYGRLHKPKSFFAVMLGAFHIVFALYKVGWEWLATSYLVMIAVFQLVLFYGRYKLSQLSPEEFEQLQRIIEERIERAEQAEDAKPENVPS